MAESKLSMKLLINPATNKVLYAEAGKECVDFLFHILSLPIAFVIRLLKEQGMVGCVSNLYESIENLNETYIQPGQNKDSLLNTVGTATVPLFLLQGAGEPQSTGNFAYRCGCGCAYYSVIYGTNCRSCGNRMTSQVTNVSPTVAAVKTPVVDSGGFVKGEVTYLLTDDLVVKPMSVISSMTIPNEIKLMDIGALKIKEFNIGKKEALKILKASLHSNNVLTKAFIRSQLKQLHLHDMIAPQDSVHL